MDRAFLCPLELNLSILILLIRRFTWLSLDIALSAVVQANAIAYVFQTELPWTISLALFLCVWIIYTLDHLLDARKIEGEPTMPRHIFHWKYASVLFILLLIVSLSSLALVFFLPEATLVWGIVVAGLVGLYVLMTWWLRVFVAKELLIAILYAVGIFIGPLSMGIPLQFFSILIFVILSLLALANLLLLSLNEKEKDQADGFSSWATIFGEEHLNNALRITYLLLLVALFLSFYVSGSLLFNIYLSIMTLMLVFSFLLYWKRGWFQRHESYRILGDFIFFLPGLVFLF